MTVDSKFHQTSKKQPRRKRASNDLNEKRRENVDLLPGEGPKFEGSSKFDESEIMLQGNVYWIADYVQNGNALWLQKRRKKRDQENFIINGNIYWHFEDKQKRRRLRDHSEITIRNNWSAVPSTDNLLELQLDGFLESVGIRSWFVRQSLGASFAAVIETARNRQLAQVDDHRSMPVPSEPQYPLSIPPLPEKARITYADRAKDPYLAKLNIMDFLRAEWGPWLDGTLSRKKLATLDISAYRAVDNWLRRTGKPLPPDIKLPTKKEVNDDILAKGLIPVGSATKVSRMLESRRRRRPGDDIEF